MAVKHGGSPAFFDRNVNDELQSVYETIIHELPKLAETAARINPEVALKIRKIIQTATGVAQDAQVKNVVGRPGATSLFKDTMQQAKSTAQDEKTLNDKPTHTSGARFS